MPLKLFYSAEVPGGWCLPHTTEARRLGGIMQYYTVVNSLFFPPDGQLT